MSDNNTTPAAPSASPINLFEIWNIFWPRRYMILICAFVVAAAAFVRVQWFTNDVYSANGILYVSNRNEFERLMEDSDEVYGSDINTSRMMSTTYIEILSTRSFFENVSDALGGAYSPGQISGMTSISARNDTELLDVYVSCPSAEGASSVANTVLKEAPNQLGTVFDGGEVRIVEWAVTPAGPVGKSRSRAVLIGLLIGLAIGCAAAFVLDYIDNKVHRADDVAKKYGVSILGEISQ